MEFLQEVFVKYWKEVIVAMLLTATLPFFRRYVRRLRARVIAFFTVRKRLETALLEAEKWRKKSEEAEQKYLAEAEEKRKAVEEAERLRKELEEKRAALDEAERKNQTQSERLRAALSKPKQEQKQPEEAKPAPKALTAKLLELLRACEELPYPEGVSSYLSVIVRTFLPANGEVLRMKVLGAVNSYIYDYEFGNLSDRDTREQKCTLFYVLMIIAQGISEKLITIDDSKKLTWKYAGELLDKVNDEYFKEHPEVSRPSEYTIREAQRIIANAFGSYPPEVIIEDKAFIQALLSSTKPAAVVKNKSKGFFGRLFGFDDDDDD